MGARFGVHSRAWERPTRYRWCMSFFDMTSDADVEDELDRVETDVVVDCDIEAAWVLVSEPGWWVNDGPLGDHEVSLGDDGLYRVSDPDAGDWLIEKATTSIGSSSAFSISHCPASGSLTR